MHRAGQRCFELFSSHWQPSASLIKDISQLGGIFMGFWICVMFGNCGSVMGVVLIAADTFSSIHSGSE